MDSLKVRGCMFESTEAVAKDIEVMDGCELVVVSKEGSAGSLRSYITKKAMNREVASEDCGGLILERYPRPDEGTYKFDVFMDLPYENGVRNRHEFKGVFAVDVSGYAGLENDRHFKALLDYVEDHPDISFSLILQTDNRAYADRMAAALKERLPVQVNHLSDEGVKPVFKTFGL